MDILLIDDDPGILRTVSRSLTARGHHLRTASSGPEAFQHMQERAPDLVISDIQMPGMDGVAILEAIRQRFPDLPVVLMTGHATVPTAVAALRLGAADYLEKPVKPEELQTCIRRVETRQL